MGEGGGDGRFTVPSIDVWYVFDFFFFKLWLPYKEKYNGHVIVDANFFIFFFDKKNSRLQLVKNKVESSECDKRYI